MKLETRCSVEVCDRAVFAAGLCHGHYKRRRQHQPLAVKLAPRGRTRTQVLLDAALEWADCPSDAPREVYSRRLNALLVAAHRFRRR